MHKWLLAILASLWLMGCDNQNWRTNDIAEIMPDLDFDLAAENGNEVHEGAFLGKTTLLYFGYTHCPDICPTTLARLAAATRQLDDETREDIQILLVSVDPARDTPTILKRYTEAFGPQFIGLTGDIIDLNAFTNRYRVTYTYSDKDGDGNYDVSYSSSVFAFNRKGEARFLIRDIDSMQDIVSDLNQLIESG